MRRARASALRQIERVRVRRPATPPILLAGLLSLSAVLQSGHAFAFAPFETDDIFSTSDVGETLLRNIVTYSQDAETRSLTLPRFDVAHRFGKDIELGFSLPFELVRQTGGGTHYAFSSSSIAVAYRIHKGSDESWAPSIGIAPQLGFPSAAPQHDIGTGQVHAYLPLIVEKEFGKWSIFSNAAYGINPGAGNRNYWFLGTAATREITDDITVGGEIYHRSSTSTGKPDTTGFNIGMKYDTAKNQALYVSVGRALQNPIRTNQVSTYFAYQLSF